jgi:hypothetical protein
VLTVMSRCVRIRKEEFLVTCKYIGGKRNILNLSVAMQNGAETLA